MPGQLRLTGANAAYILEGSDTITEDVVVKFPEDGNYVTEDSDGNVDLDGNVNARAVLVDMLDGEESATSTLSNFKHKGNTKLELKTNGNAEFAGSISTESFVKIDRATAGLVNLECNLDGTTTYQIKADGSITCEKNSSVDFIKYTAGGVAKFTVSGGGQVTAANIKSRNVELQLDPDDPSKVLDVKESIRNMQAALYRLKAAVLIPDTTVDQLRLRILEALETITEEVD